MDLYSENLFYNGENWKKVKPTFPPKFIFDHKTALINLWVRLFQEVKFRKIGNKGHFKLDFSIFCKLFVKMPT